MKFTNTPQIKVRLMILSIILLLLNPFWILLIVHYFILPLNWIFNSSTCVPSSEHNTLSTFEQVDFSATLLNILYLSVFFIQHIFMATLRFKIKAHNLWTNYPLYERLIYNLTSVLLLITIYTYSNPQNYVVFSLNRWITTPLTIWGLICFVISNKQLGSTLLMQFSFSEILKKDELELISYENKEEKGGLSYKGLYGLMRHPMQAGFLFMFTFGSPIFTFEKCVMLVVFLIGITIGVMKEEERLGKRFNEYENYKNQVKARFIPYII